jgi:sterol O-acyltransferase
MYGVAEFYIRIVCPYGAMAFILFLLVFEYVCNCYAELTSFGDRLFYQDFWNCTSYDEFGRKWNRIVHEFFYRHVYLVSRKKLHMSPTQGYVVTTLCSAVMHEYFLLCLTGFVKPYIIILMLSQGFMTFLFMGILRIRKASALV